MVASAAKPYTVSVGIATIPPASKADTAADKELAMAASDWSNGHGHTGHGEDDLDEVDIIDADVAVDEEVGLRGLGVPDGVTDENEMSDCADVDSFLCLML